MLIYIIINKTLLSELIKKTNYFTKGMKKTGKHCAGNPDDPGPQYNDCANFFASVSHKLRTKKSHSQRFH